MISKKLLIDEIKKTKETIKKLESIKKEQGEKYEKLVEDCNIGIVMNDFVLGKLEEEKQKI